MKYSPLEEMSSQILIEVNNLESNLLIDTEIDNNKRKSQKIEKTIKIGVESAAEETCSQNKML